MKKYCLTYMAAIAALSASAAAPQAERKTDSLHIASLSPREAATIDSIVAMRVRLQPKQIESIFDTNDVVAIDTLDSGNDAIQVVLYSNNTWKYVRNREIAKDSTIFEKYWDTTTLFPYKEVDMSSMPKSVVIDLVDSVTSYHCPYQGSVHPRGKYGPRRRRQHQHEVHVHQAEEHIGPPLQALPAIGAHAALYEGERGHAQHQQKHEQRERYHQGAHHIHPQRAAESRSVGAQIHRHMPASQNACDNGQLAAHRLKPLMHLRSLGEHTDVHDHHKQRQRQHTLAHEQRKRPHYNTGEQPLDANDVGHVSRHSQYVKRHRPLMQRRAQSQASRHRHRQNHKECHCLLLTLAYAARSASVASRKRPYAASAP